MNLRYLRVTSIDNHALHGYLFARGRNAEEFAATPKKGRRCEAQIVTNGIMQQSSESKSMLVVPRNSNWRLLETEADPIDRIRVGKEDNEEGFLLRMGLAFVSHETLCS